MQTSNYFIIPPFGELIRFIKIKQLQEMKNMQSTIPKKVLELKPCLPLIAQESEETDAATEFVEFLLKVKAGSGSTAPSYKKRVQRFDEGSPMQWIAVLNSLSEIWKQNSITNPSDRMATIRTLLREDALTTFESSIEDSKSKRKEEQERNSDEEEAEDEVIEIPLTLQMVEEGLQAVSASVFPHRALEIQKLWMRRVMKKPRELTIRKTAAALSRINNSLPLFPGATSEDKFSAQEIVELLEWCLPQKWRTKFDLMGYIPSLDDKAKLITACETLERNEEPAAKLGSKVTVKKGGKSFAKVSNRGDEKVAKLYCTLHGHNTTHDTAACFVLKKQAKGKDSSGTSTGNVKKTFTGKSFRKEIHLLSKKKSKHKVLDMFASIIKSEQSKLSSKKKKGNKQASRSSEASDANSDNSDTEMSVELLEVSNVHDTKIAKKPSRSNQSHNSNKSSATIEEKSFQARIAALGQAPSDVDAVSSSDSD